MPEQSALNYYNTLRAREDLSTGPGNLFDRSHQLLEFDRRMNQPVPRDKPVTYGDVFRGLVGAGIGAGVARGASRVLGVDSRMSDKLETIGMGLGAAMNTGRIKRASDEDREYMKMEEKNARMIQQRKHAFRIGFLKAAKDVGLLKEALVPVLAVNPADFLNLPSSMARGLASGAAQAGRAAGIGLSPTKADVDLTEDEIERELLQEKLDRLRRDRESSALRKVLAKRKPGS